MFGIWDSEGLGQIPKVSLDLQGCGLDDSDLQELAKRLGEAQSVTIDIRGYESIV